MANSWVSAYLKAHSYTPNDLCVMTGMCRATAEKIMDGQQVLKMGYGSAKKLCEIVGCDMEELFDTQVEMRELR